MIRCPTLSAIALLHFACTQPPVPETRVPEWSRGAVWYQIFPERFRNGDPGNDPTAQDAALTDYPIWQTSPWPSDWYRLQSWEQARSSNFYACARAFENDHVIAILNVSQAERSLVCPVLVIPAVNFKKRSTENNSRSLKLSCPSPSHLERHRFG